MPKIALLVLYNHRFDKNIPRIENLYKNRFSHIYHLVPFYNGNIENVIPVYESSFQFQSYISQGYQIIKHHNFTHYFVVADDMIINPLITELNIFDFSGIPEDSCFIPYLRNIFRTHNTFWLRHYHEAIDYNPNKPGVEISNIIPSKQEADRMMRNKGFDPGGWSLLLSLKVFLYCIQAKSVRLLLKNFKYFFKSKKLNYPLLYGWCDILLLTEDMMTRFSTYCGAFAATDLFVEIALPTALAMCDTKICTNEDLKLNNECNREKINELYKKYDAKLDKLLSEYPENTFFIHPIKLSKWK